MRYRHNLVRRDSYLAFRVRAETVGDLEVVSSMLQDAIVPISETIFQPSKHWFVMMAQRFRWEGSPTLLPAGGHDEGETDESRVSFERILCAVRVENVTDVRSTGIDLADRGQILELLSLHLAEGHLDLAFAGDKTIRLLTVKLSVHAEDIGEAWPTIQRPSHPGNEA
ncbi:MAG: hypothetical protein CMM47_03585 [Rhodospirillaceae bacterium]|nr:hypothetical protein [Rhodospirillaceae bacterium]